MSTRELLDSSHQWHTSAGFRAKLDGNEKLATFSVDLERAVIETIEEGHYTKDLAICVHGTTKVSVICAGWLTQRDAVRTGASHDTANLFLHLRASTSALLPSAALA